MGALSRYSFSMSFTGGEAGEGYPLVGEGDDVGELADEVSRELGPLDRGLNFAANFPLSGQTLRQVLKIYNNIINTSTQPLQ